MHTDLFGRRPATYGGLPAKTGRSKMRFDEGPNEPAASMAGTKINDVDPFEDSGHAPGQVGGACRGVGFLSSVDAAQLQQEALAWGGSRPSRRAGRHPHYQTFQFMSYHPCVI